MDEGHDGRRTGWTRTGDRMDEGQDGCGTAVCCIVMALNKNHNVLSFA